MSCRHCDRDLEDDEIAVGLCSSDDCPRHDGTKKPCRSPYCECDVGKCSHPGCYDARGTMP